MFLVFILRYVIGLIYLLDVTKCFQVAKTAIFLITFIYLKPKILTKGTNERIWIKEN